MEIFENNKFFRRIGLAKEWSSLISMDIQTFRDHFNENVGDDVNFFGVSGHKKNFHGRIRNNSFKILRPTSLINNTNQASTIGLYEEHDSKTKIYCVTYIPINFILLFGGGLILIAFFFNYLSITADNVPLVAFFGFNGFYIFFGLRLYWILRRSVKNLADDIEREVGFWLSKVNALQQKL
jgi:hypothetical protein